MCRHTLTERSREREREREKEREEEEEEEERKEVGERTLKTERAVKKDALRSLWQEKQSGDDDDRASLDGEHGTLLEKCWRRESNEYT